MVGLPAPRVGHRPCQSGVSDLVNFRFSGSKFLAIYNYVCFGPAGTGLEELVVWPGPVGS